MNSATIDSIMLCGFGGPTPGCCGRRVHCPKAGCGFEAECFVSKILGDDPAQQSRVSQVSEHYRHFGGYSPYNERTEAQRAALEQLLAQRGHPLPVVVGYRNWPPWYADGWRKLAEQGCRNTLLVVLAPHQGKRSWDDYLEEAANAREEVSAAPAIAGHSQALYDHPGFIEALAARVTEQILAAAGHEHGQTVDGLLMTAHAIPQPAERGAYRPQVEETARLLAQVVSEQHPSVQGIRLGFQSAPDESRIPWSQPVVDQALTALHEQGCRRVVVIPIGFLVDHMEVLYDLDVELQEHAQTLGVQLLRAQTVEDHPAFIGAMADTIIEKIGR